MSLFDGIEKAFLKIHAEGDLAATRTFDPMSGEVSWLVHHDSSGRLRQRFLLLIEYLTRDSPESRVNGAMTYDIVNERMEKLRDRGARCFPVARSPGEREVIADEFRAFTQERMENIAWENAEDIRLRSAATATDSREERNSDATAAAAARRAIINPILVANNWSVNALADQTDCGTATVYRFYNGGNSNSRTKAKIAKALGLKPFQLPS